MEKTKITFRVIYGTHTVDYEYSWQPEIFQMGINFKIDNKFSFEDLLQYVNVTRNCYFADTCGIPLMLLADYIGIHWGELKSLGTLGILRKYYSQTDLGEPL